MLPFWCVFLRCPGSKSPTRFGQDISYGNLRCPCHESPTTLVSIFRMETLDVLVIPTILVRIFCIESKQELHWKVQVGYQQNIVQFVGPRKPSTKS